MLISEPSFASLFCSLDPYNTDDRDLVLNEFRGILADLKSHRRYHTDPFYYYGCRNWAEEVLKSWKEYKELDDVAGMMDDDLA